MQKFTLEAANALIPELTRTLARTTQMLGQARPILKRLAQKGAGPSLERFRDLGRPLNTEEAKLKAEVERARMWTDLIGEEVRALTHLGVIVKDVERGLVDFRSFCDGEQEVLLCWQLGEKEIGHYHGLHTGFVDRHRVEGHRFFDVRQLRPPRTGDSQ